MDYRDGARPDRGKRRLAARVSFATRRRTGHEADASAQPAVALPIAAAQAEGDWLQLLAREVSQRLAAGETGIIDDLTARFESTCIKSGLAHTGGRKVEAAQLLGWGRNTLTRKIQELGLEHE